MKKPFISFIVFTLWISYQIASAATASKSCPLFLDLLDTQKKAELFGPIDEYAHGYLPVGSGHVLYYEESGNPKGVPIVFVHGGPGAGISAKQRQFFDPNLHRAILFDQRGSGKSEYTDLMFQNNTAELVKDMEKLRKRLKVSKWIISGGSWGSTLSLAYAEKYPEHVSGLILRGIFLGQLREIDFLNPEKISPEIKPHWDYFLSILSPAERANPLVAYYNRIQSSDPKVRQEAAEHYIIYEGALNKAQIPEKVLTLEDTGKSPDAALRNATIEITYIYNNSWLAGSNSLLAHIDRIRNIPAVIVQGLDDHVVPPTSGARALHAAWPEAAYFEVPNSGHSMYEPEITSYLVKAAASMANQLK